MIIHPDGIIFITMKNLLLTISISFFTLLAQGQITDFEKFKQQREKEMNQFEQKVNHEMDSLRTAHDKAFAKMLEGNWKREDVFPSKPASEKTKPTAPPVYKPDVSQDAAQGRSEGVGQDDKPEAALDVIQDAAQEDKTEELAFNKAFQFQNESLFGNEWKMILISSKWPTLKGNPDPSSITAYWKSCSEKEYDLIDYLP
jgi:hypothetical protein